MNLIKIKRFALYFQNFTKWIVATQDGVIYRKDSSYIYRLQRSNFQKDIDQDDYIL